jgi:hypothetical protein
MRTELAVSRVTVDPSASGTALILPTGVLSIIAWSGMEVRWRSKRSNAGMTTSAAAIEAARHISARALVVHAIDDEAVSFYVPYGFQGFPTERRTLCVPIETISNSL